MIKVITELCTTDCYFKTTAHIILNIKQLSGSVMFYILYTSSINNPIL